jgi:E2F/DP family winged-helix DNA-binding domain
VRRRVYDALNVLYAAGVLRKEGKFVSCDTTVLEMTRVNRDNNLSIESSGCKSTVVNNIFDEQIRCRIEEMKL